MVYNIRMDLVVRRWDGSIVDSKWISYVDKLISMKAHPGLSSNEDNMWDNVIPEIIKIWQEKTPDDWESFVINVHDLRNTRKDKYGSSTDSSGAVLRYKLDVPEFVVLILRKLYPVGELDMDKKFWYKFGQRFPIFRVAEVD